MHISVFVLDAWAALIAGVLIFVRPRLLTTIVGVYLIIIGLLGIGIIR